MQVWTVVGITSTVCTLFFLLIGFFTWRLTSVTRKKKNEQRRLHSIQIRHLHLDNHPFGYSIPIEAGLQIPTLHVEDCESSAYGSDADKQRRRNTIAQLENVLALENGGTEDETASPTEESSWTSAGDETVDVIPSVREVPQLEFSLVFASTTNCLNVHVIRAVNLPSKYIRDCSSYAKVTLTNDGRKTVRSTQVVKDSLNPEYEECFSFSGYSLQDIQTSFLRFSVYVKASVLKRYRKLGDVVFHMTQARLMPDQPMIYLERVTFYRRTRKFMKRQTSSGDLGYVFLSLQYQPSAERLKILLRKAENLPKENGVSLVQSEYYTIIHLMKGIEEVNRKETNSASGPNPIWNQAFLFDLKPQEHQHYWLQFVVMKGKKYQRHWPLGKFLIGPKTSANGISHWNEAMEPRAHETARWHCIL